MFESMDISLSGMVAQRIRHDTTAANLANIEATRAAVDANGQPVPYRRQFAVFRPAANGRGVEVDQLAIDRSAGPLKLDPAHPDAIRFGPEKGMVRMPNVDMAQEILNGSEAVRAYEANATALQLTKQMYAADMRILA